MTDAVHPTTLEKLADGAIAKIVARFVLPALFAIALYFIKGAWEENQAAWKRNAEAQEQTTRALQTIQTGLAVAVESLNNNKGKDQEQDKAIDKLEDRINNMSDPI